MNRTALITGAASGTGYAIAEKFAQNGYHIVITSRSEESAEKAAEKIATEYGVSAYGYALDINCEQRIKDIFADIDSKNLTVETVVLNAADLGYGDDPAKGLDFFETKVADFRRVFETNLVWNFMIVRQAALRMRENHKGAIVFIGSNTSDRPIPNRAAYCASKGGMVSMSRAFAIDLGPYGIRSNVVKPGTIKTDRWAKMGDKRIVTGSITPIGDISDFEDIANVAYFLGCDLSKNITGTEIAVDGGMSTQLFPRR